MHISSLWSVTLFDANRTRINSWEISPTTPRPLEQETTWVKETGQLGNQQTKGLAH